MSRHRLSFYTFLAAASWVLKVAWLDKLETRNTITEPISVTALSIRWAMRGPGADGHRVGGWWQRDAPPHRSSGFSRPSRLRGRPGVDDGRSAARHHRDRLSIALTAPGGGLGWGRGACSPGWQPAGSCQAGLAGRLAGSDLRK